jgi:matrixin
MARLLLVVFFLATCVGQRGAVVPRRVLSVYSIEHADLVREAASRWYQQTNGCIAVSVAPGDVEIVPMVPDGIRLGKWRENERRIYIAWQSIGNSELAIVVLMHEIGHVLGMEHVDDPSAIMHNSVGWGNNMRIADRIELNRSTGCPVNPP